MKKLDERGALLKRIRALEAEVAALKARPAVVIERTIERTEVIREHPQPYWVPQYPSYPWGPIIVSGDSCQSVSGTFIPSQMAATISGMN